jgi:hypothetical protein
VGGWLQDASGGSFLSTAVVLAVSLLLGGLVMITLRRQADKPVVVRPPAAERRAPASGPGSGGPRPHAQHVRKDLPNEGSASSGFPARGTFVRIPCARDLSRQRGGASMWFLVCAW